MLKEKRRFYHSSMTKPSHLLCYISSFSSFATINSPLDKPRFLCYNKANRRLSEPLGVVEAASSSLVTQTKQDQSEHGLVLFFCSKTGFLALFWRYIAILELYFTKIHIKLISTRVECTSAFSSLFWFLEKKWSF